MTIQEAIERLAKAGKTYPLACEVLSNNDDGTVNLKPIDEPEFFDVRITAEVNPTHGVEAMPKVGSNVFIIQTGPATGIVVLSSSLEYWRLRIGTTKVEQTAEGLEIRKGNDTLKDALKLIIEAVQKIVVIQGTNPDQMKLAEALTKVNNILR